MEHPRKDQTIISAARRINNSSRRIAQKLGLILAVSGQAQQPGTVSYQQSSICCPTKPTNFLPLRKHGFRVRTLAAGGGKKIQVLRDLELNRGQRLAVAGDRQSQIPVGIASNGLNLSSAAGNESDLRPLETWARLLEDGKNAAAIGQPFQFIRSFVIESHETLGFFAADVKQIYAAQRLIGLKSAKGDLLAIRGPGQESRRLGDRHNSQDFFVVAAQIRAEQSVLADLGIICPSVCHALAVGRKCNVAVDVVNHGLRSPAQNRRAIEVVIAIRRILRFAEVDVVSIRRECKSPVGGG